MPSNRCALTGAVCMIIGCGDAEPGNDPAGGSSGDATAAAATATDVDGGPAGTSDPTPPPDDNDDDAPPSSESGEASGTGETGTGSDTDEIPEIPPECEDSVLADVVAGMEPGSWAAMPDNDSLANLEMESALLYWADSGVFDAATRRLHWVGGPGSCCADPATYQRISYDELSDTWSIEATPFEGSGHAYDGNAWEPGTSNHYFSKFSDPTIRVYDGDGWSDLSADLPFDAGTTSGLTWFPEMGGLVYVGGYGNLGFWDGAAWSIPADPDPGWGSYNGFAEYSSPHGLVWMGGGNGANEINYVLDGTGALTRMPDAPVTLGNGQGLHFAEPALGNFIVYNYDAGWWELDPIAETWTEFDAGAPGFDGSLFQVPLPHCGVTLFFDHYWENRTPHLYRHG